MAKEYEIIARTMIQNSGTDMRVTYGNRWMVFSGESYSWIVYERKPLQKKTRIIGTFNTINLDDAMDELLKE